ncbi:MAG: hypothetical protein ACJ8E0_11485 [Sphingomicrobium sp.]
MLLASGPAALPNDPMTLREPDPHGIKASPLLPHWWRLFNDINLDRQGPMS